MTRRGTSSKRTPLPIWSDGIHYVRAAGVTDTHPLRWLAAAHRVTDSTFRRYAATMDEALSLAIDATQAWIKRVPSDAAYKQVAPLPAASSLQGSKRQRGRPRKKTTHLPPFATTHFNCIRANPVAQVWQCVSLPGDRQPAGRKRDDGAPVQVTPFPHLKMECAVLMWETPVRNEDGTVRVFHNWQQAEEFAVEAYYNTPEDERISWTLDHQTVGRTLNFDIIFDPVLNGDYRPFSLWFPRYNRPVFVDRTKPSTTADDHGTRSIRTLQETNPEAYLQIQEARAKARKLDRVPSLSDEPLRFRTIWEAHKEAEYREGMLRGNKL